MHIGIDPGLSGAVAILDQQGTLVALHDTPVLTLSTSRGTRQEYDVPGLVALLAPYRGPGATVLLEESQAMPGQGTRSMFTVGLGFGVWLGILGTLELAYTRVRPGVWKRSLGLSRDKEAARLQVPCNSSLAPICGGRRTMAEQRRCCWRGMGGSTGWRQK